MSLAKPPRTYLAILWLRIGETIPHYWPMTICQATTCWALLSSALWAAEVTQVRVGRANLGTARIISPQLFGSYQEEHWGDITPAIYEQYIVNPSFEPWYER